MTTVDTALVETLLNMSESDTLDFKRDQYLFAGASDEQKSELVKDILAFGNAWKTSDAFILVGVDENPGARATVVGVKHHLDDADIQQLVNAKTNTAVSFVYLPITVDGLAVGVIRIAREQQRPVFLRRRFGRLDQNTVYVRRGSSTAVATPDEIASMGAAMVGIASEPEVQIELGDPVDRRRFGHVATVTSRSLREPPTPEPFPPAVEQALSAAYQLTNIMELGPDPKRIRAHKQELGLLVGLGFWSHNSGAVLIEDLRVVVEVPKLDGLRVLDDLPPRPRGRFEIQDITPLHNALLPNRISTMVDDAGDHWELMAHIGKVQPNASVWSDPFWIGSPTECELRLVAKVFADNISRRVEIPLTVKITVEEDWLPDDAPDCDEDD